LKDEYKFCHKNIAAKGGCCKKNRWLNKNCKATCVIFDKQEKCGGDGNLLPFDKETIKEGYKMMKAAREKYRLEAIAKKKRINGFKNKVINDRKKLDASNPNWF